MRVCKTLYAILGVDPEKSTRTHLSDTADAARCEALNNANFLQAHSTIFAFAQTDRVVFDSVSRSSIGFVRSR